MGRTDARAFQSNTNYSYLEIGFNLLVEYTMEGTPIVLYVHFLFGKFCTPNIFNRSRIIVTLSVVNCSTNRREENKIVPDSAFASDYFCAPFLNVYTRYVKNK